MAIIIPKHGTTTPTPETLIQYELAIDTSNKRIYVGNSGGSGDLVGSAPGGSDTYVQFNDGGNLGGDSGLTYNKTTDTLTIGGNLVLNAQGDLRLSDADSSNYIAFQAPTTVSNNNIYTLPSAVGSANQVLRIASVASNDATLEWATVSGGGGTPGGSDTEVQFNDGGSFGGDAGLTYNKTTDSLTITGDLAVNGGDITTSTTTASIFDATATTVNAFGAATTLNLGYDATVSSTTNISTGITASGQTKTINIGTSSAGSSTTLVYLGSTLGSSTIYMQGNVTQIGSTFAMQSSLLSLDSIAMGNAKGGRKGITVTADDPASAPVKMAIDNQDGGGEIDIFGFAAIDYTTGYIKCDTPQFQAGDITGQSNGYYLELNDNTGIFTVAAYVVDLVVLGSYIEFGDGSQQITKTPDYLLFDMGIV